jgi:D-3-phosphoglycerate dehydrogenase
MRKKILICTSTFAESDTRPLDLLTNENYELVLNPYKRTLSEDEVIQLGYGCSGIISGSEPLTERVLQSLPDLRCISRVGVGLNNVDMKFAEEKKIITKNTPDAPTRAVAELTTGLIFDLLRRISLHDREIRQGVWKKKLGHLLFQKNVGIIGLGRIGRVVAEMTTNLGAHVHGYDLYPDYQWAQKYSVDIVNLPDLLQKCDIITIHIPFSKENAALIGEKEIMLMRRGSFLLNLSRGGIVDERALYSSLKNGHLAGAALDTFESEPYRGPLAELDTVILTPHMGSYTHESRSAMELEAVRNLIGVLGAEKDTI